ncbi:peptidoglycan DD-metalloendopeptidase family protein [Methylocystis sp.]|uniref:murein hydrolase activator EnvC family protein n=1 Tax=Methylocystis sp. TaxID=1911079 RepID=UPI0025F71833|nr:peptidoglycan DD-metalloendopeptidase family protein [Methylocystis sp.]
MPRMDMSVSGRARNEAAKRGLMSAALFAAAAASSAHAEQQRPEARDVSSKQQELRGVEDTMGAARERARQLEEQLIDHAAARERLNGALIEATLRMQETETRAAEIEERLSTLTENERKIVSSLDGRRELIIEILTVLQRMGRRPPPALMARPHEILEAVRASLALGAVLPQMRAEARQLQRDLTELEQTRDGVRREQDLLGQQRASLKAQRERLAPMIAERQEAISRSQGALQAETERARSLAQRAMTLKDLIARMEAESSAAQRAAEEARKADEERLKAQAKLSERQRLEALAAPFKDPARLAPAVAFVDLKGRLPAPASGQIIRRFGAPDGFGGKEKGLSIAARENGVVIAPCDGWIAFSGPYRSYGQLLIINAGGGYYVVLAGMSRTNVNVGQFVLAGEPVASMGDGAAQTAATIAIGAKQPILYVEFRKDGASIDSGPWWAKSDSRKVGG